MQTLFQIVTLQGAVILTAAELAERYPTSTRQPAQHERPELRNQPCIDGLCGPMWGGYHDEEGDSIFFERDSVPNVRASYGSQKPVASMYVRYESWEAYELYSR
jgi:hypothetical protein